MRFKEYLKQKSGDDYFYRKLYDSVEWSAGRRKNFSLDAAEYLDKSRSEKEKWIEKVFVPLWKKAKEPELYSSELEKVIHKIFSKSHKK